VDGGRGDSVGGMDGKIIISVNALWYQMIRQGWLLSLHLQEPRAPWKKYGNH
jgi:hypothetical protein